MKIRFFWEQVGDDLCGHKVSAVMIPGEAPTPIPECMKGQWRKYFAGWTPHRNDDGPSFISTRGNHTQSYWYKNGILGRGNDKPSYELKSDTWLVRKWYEDGLVSRTDGPAWQERHTQGRTLEDWYFRGLIHRIDGPAIAGSRINEYYLFGMHFWDDDYEKLRQLGTGLELAIEVFKRKRGVRPSHPEDQFLFNIMRHFGASDQLVKSLRASAVISS